MDSIAGNSDMFMEVVRCLEESGSLSDVIIVGSWAEYCYEMSRLLGPDYSPRIKTMDMDLLIPRLGGPSRDFVKRAKEHGFIYLEDRLTGCSRLFGRDDFEVEFLTPQRGDGRRPLPRSSVGVNAQQLTHLDVLARFSLQIKVEDVCLVVPFPEAYAAQKLVVNGRRKLKAIADREKINNILPYLDPSRFVAVLSSLTRKELRMARETADVMGNPLIMDALKLADAQRMKPDLDKPFDRFCPTNSRSEAVERVRAGEAPAIHGNETTSVPSASDVLSSAASYSGAKGPPTISTMKYSHARGTTG